VHLQGEWVPHLGQRPPGQHHPCRCLLAHPRQTVWLGETKALPDLGAACDLLEPIAGAMFRSQDQPAANQVAGAELLLPILQRRGHRDDPVHPDR